MKYNIKTDLIDEFIASLFRNAEGINSELRSWSKWHDGGRIIVGWKRIAYSNGYRESWDLSRVELSTWKILRRKVRVWLNKR